jgi:hypothetical protein
MQDGALEIHLAPTQAADLGRPQPVPEGDQDHGRIAGFARMIERAARRGLGLELKAHPHMLRHACGYGGTESV